jgi:carbon storage regulator
MLVLSRRVGETIHIGNDIVILVTRINADRVRLGISAPVGVRIMRAELIAEPPAEVPAELALAEPPNAGT